MIITLIIIKSFFFYTTQIGMNNVTNGTVQVAEKAIY